jgi:glutaredoxin
VLPDALNATPGRREAKRRTGRTDVPILILDDDTTIGGSNEIVAWAKANPA